MNSLLAALGVFGGLAMTIVPAAAQSAMTSGFVVETLKAGTGPSPANGQTCVMHYTGTLASDGSKFDSSHDRGKPFEFKIGVGQVIRGWDEGVAQMKVGGHYRLKIRSDYGYGARGAGGVIPPNADLIFDVELIAVK